MNLGAAHCESPFFRLSLDLMIHLKSLRCFLYLLLYYDCYSEVLILN